MSRWPEQVGEVVSVNGAELVAAARRVAAAAHEGQVDKSGAAYIAHPERVAARVAARGPEAVAVGWLHDVVEDTDVTVERLRAQFPDAVVDAVVALTRLPGDVGEDYYRRVAGDPLAVVVKLADLDDNTDPVRVAALDAATRDRLAVKYAHARAVLASLVAAGGGGVVVEGVAGGSRGVGGGV